ncbi:hypothetical protein EUGRSUZ_I01577 [Eucalyptus grandis]|uniref:Uncharacterized protein n=2 Tax=Eucalyptus grandis TaxID=71139 RepID=A0ACC3JFA2_EUCGR|nr:hypothetical protein EUGRSUZ_I01577 [Eucalyptus grandis]
MKLQQKIQNLEFSPKTKFHSSSPMVCSRKLFLIISQSPFLLKEQPSVSLARPPVGWHKTVWQLPQTTTV